MDKIMGSIEIMQSTKNEHEILMESDAIHDSFLAMKSEIVKSVQHWKSNLDEPSACKIYARIKNEDIEVYSAFVSVIENILEEEK